jgi:hypothetical protein
VGFREQIKESTADGSELVEVVLNVLRDENASTKERMDAATWLADMTCPPKTRPGFLTFTLV